MRKTVPTTTFMVSLLVAINLIAAISLVQPVKSITDYYPSWARIAIMPDGTVTHTYYPSNDNAWDLGYPAGGNYWTDYNGSDLNRDGLGDTPYLVFDNDTDHYPLFALIASIDIQPSPLPSSSPEATSKATPTPSPEPKQFAEPFPIVMVIASIASVAVIGAGLLVYLKERKR